MLLAPLAYDVAFYGGFVAGAIGIGAVAIGAAAQRAAKQHDTTASAGAPAALPAAVLARHRPPSRSPVLVQLLGAFASIGGPAASIWLWFHSHDVMFVRDEGGAAAPSTERRRYVGSEAFQPPRSLDAHPRRRATSIVNESSKELVAHSIGYGDRSTFAPVAIPPGASLPVDSVDHLGPDDQPPGWVTVTRSQTVAEAGIAASASRVWLTW